MEKLTMSEIASFLKRDLVGDRDAFISKIVTDSREASYDTLFVPILGTVHDGHNFIKDCYDKGCRNFLIDDNHDMDLIDVNFIKVSDTTRALGEIAKGYKEKFDIPFVAITGSVGKTSAKDMVYGILSEKFNTLKNEGNFNNEIGLPKTLLNLDSFHEVAITEMGMYVKGEISYLCSLVNPDVAVITNIGMSHIENFDSQDGIFEAKMEIAQKFEKNNTLIVNGDDKYLKTLIDKKHDYKLITCGFEKYNDIHCKSYEICDNQIKFVCVYNNLEHEFVINNLAKHNILNAMLSIAVGLCFDLSYEELRNGLLNFSLSKNRLDIFNTGKYKIIDDTYNASYDSMVSALDVLNNFNGRKVAILGDIFELGNLSEEIHRNVGKAVSCDVLVTIGNNAKFISEEAKNNGVLCYHFFSKNLFYKEMDNILLDGDNILLKASRAMEFDKIIEELK